MIEMMERNIKEPSWTSYSFRNPSPGMVRWWDSAKHLLLGLCRTEMVTHPFGERILWMIDATSPW